MAYNIEEKNGVYSFAENGRARDLAWHKLGQKYDGEMDVMTALSLSHANFEVSKVNAGYFNPATNKYENDPAHKYIMRMDNNDILGLVSESYGVVQNKEAFDFVDNLCTGKSGDPFIESAGVLGKGERIFVCCKFPERFKIGEVFGDEGELYAVITTSHDGSAGIDVLMTPIRVVCNNTLTAAMYHNKSRYTFRHTRNVQYRMKENFFHCTQILRIEEATRKIIEEQNQRLNSIMLTGKIVEMICAQMAFGHNYNTFKKEGLTSENLSKQSKNVYEGIMETVESGVGQDLFKNKSGNWLYNGLSCYWQNRATYGSKTSPDDQTRKFKNFFGGTVKDKMDIAYNSIVSLK